MLENVYEYFLQLSLSAWKNLCVSNRRKKLLRIINGDISRRRLQRKRNELIKKIETNRLDFLKYGQDLFAVVGTYANTPNCAYACALLPPYLNGELDKLSLITVLEYCRIMIFSQLTDCGTIQL